MPSVRWEDMKQMRRLTKKQATKILLRSLPVAILAAIAFFAMPSILPESYDNMKRSVAMIECKEYYEITSNGKVVAYCNGINADTTLNIVSSKKGIAIERKAMVCGCWINKYSFISSCRGRILATNPFTKAYDPLSTVNNNIKDVIAKTITKLEKAVANNNHREEELNYYLNTHNVKDEGYNTIAEYAETNKNGKENHYNSIKILQSLQQKGDIKIRRNTSYTLIYRATNNKTSRVSCAPLLAETSKAPKGTIVLQTQNEFMPYDAVSIYRFDIFNLAPESGDSITIAAIFGLTEKSTEDAVHQKPNIFKGVALSPNKHDIPSLLAPEGAPIFNSRGFFIGINSRGGIVR